MQPRSGGTEGTEDVRKRHRGSVRLGRWNRITTRRRMARRTVGPPLGAAQPGITCLQPCDGGRRGLWRQRRGQPGLGLRYLCGAAVPTLAPIARRGLAAARTGPACLPIGLWKLIVDFVGHRSLLCTTSHHSASRPQQLSNAPHPLPAAAHQARERPQSERPRMAGSGAVVGTGPEASLAVNRTVDNPIGNPAARTFSGTGARSSTVPPAMAIPGVRKSGTPCTGLGTTLVGFEKSPSVTLYSSLFRLRIELLGGCLALFRTTH